MRSFSLLLFILISIVSCRTGEIPARPDTEEKPAEAYAAEMDSNNVLLTSSLSPDKTLFLANRQVKLCENYYKKFPNDANSPKYLVYGANAARAARNPAKAIAFYDEVIRNFTTYPDLPEVMFMKGFVADTELGDKKMAQEAYHALISKYPGHQLSANARKLLTQLYMTDEEIIKMLEEKNK